MTTWLFTLIFIIQGVSQCSAVSACSKANVTADKETCLQAVRDAIIDTDRFWFGSQYSARCPASKAGNLDCTSIGMLSPGSHSIASLVFWSSMFDPKLITRFLEVTYTSKPGMSAAPYFYKEFQWRIQEGCAERERSYSGCGTTVTSNETKTFRLDPLSPNAYQPWDARDIPVMSWPTVDEKLYALFIIDVGFGFVHGIYLNIMGTDLSTATKVQEYAGPMNFRRVPNPYVFLLFEQTHQINMSSQWMGIINNLGMKFNLSDFQEQYQLIGPVAVNWILVHYDAYSVNFLIQNKLLDNCASLVQDKVTIFHNNRPWLNTSLSLSVFLKVRFDVQAISFNMCCKQFDYSSKQFTVDPLGSKPVLPAETRSGQKVSLELEMAGFLESPVSPFQGKRYAILMMDPDVPSDTAGTNARPLLHWLHVNMQVDQAGLPSGGKELLGYSGPAPPDPAPHTYYYLLLEQKNNITLENTLDYDMDGCRSPGRCLFNVDKFLSEQNLTIAGVSWMTAYNDYYTNYTKTLRGDSMDTYCSWTPGYKSTCGQPQSQTTTAKTAHTDKNANNTANTNLISLFLVFVCNLAFIIHRF